MNTLDALTLLGQITRSQQAQALHDPALKMLLRADELLGRIDSIDANDLASSLLCLEKYVSGRWLDNLWICQAALASASPRIVHLADITSPTAHEACHQLAHKLVFVTQEVLCQRTVLRWCAERGVDADDGIVVKLRIDALAKHIELIPAEVIGEAEAIREAIRLIQRPTSQEVQDTRTQLELEIRRLESEFQSGKLSLIGLEKPRVEERLSHTEEAIPKKPDCPISIVDHTKRRIRITGELVTLSTRARIDVIATLVNAFPGALSLKELKAQSGHGDADQVLKRLVRSNPQLAKHVRLAKQSGNGYGLVPLPRLTNG